MIVFLELLTFSVGLVVFVVQSKQGVDAFSTGRDLLNQQIGLANTLILLTGGWCMANGIASLRQGHRVMTSRWVAGAILAGIAFLLLKGTEYAEKLRHGIGLGDDAFFTLYWLLTGFHFLHVVVAVVLLAVMWAGIRRGEYHRDHLQDVESSGIFWHMCDLVWLLLYPIIYLLR